MSEARPQPFTVAGAGGTLAGESDGSGPPIVLCHGLTAARGYVVHGSRTLARRGFRTIAYDARGHGESEPARDGYAYDRLVADLGALLAELTGERRCVLAGHSMGAHTLTALALAEPERVAALVVVGPSFTGEEPTEAGLAYWDRLAEGLADEGVDGFLAAYDDGLDPEWRETLLRIARQRLELHRHPGAVAQALRDVPRSRPFGDLAELAALELPALVVGSHDDADPGHPYAVAEAWAQRLPNGRLVSEEPGASPLAWQGGRLSRAIADFCESPEVAAALVG